MNDDIQIRALENRVNKLEQQLDAIGNLLAAERIKVEQLEKEVVILKEGGNL